MSNNFTAIGYVRIPKKNFITEFNTNGKHSRKLGFSVYSTENASNTFCTVWGRPVDVLNLPSKDNIGEKVQINWNDRLEQKSLNLVANYAKFKYITHIKDDSGAYLSISEDFISSYDFLNYLEENLQKLPESTRVIANGRITRNPSGSRIYTTFDLRSIEIIPEESTAIYHNGTTFTMEMLYDKNGLIEDNVKGSYILNAYTTEYIKGVGNKYLPICVKYDASEAINIINNYSKGIDVGKTSKEIENGKAKIANRLGYLKNNINDNHYVRMSWIGKYKNGAEEVEFNESMLTEAQKEEIAFGEKTVDDYRQRAIGERKEEFIIISPNLFGDYTGGLVSTEIDEESMASMVYKPEENEQVNSYAESINNKSSNSILDDIFN